MTMQSGQTLSHYRLVEKIGEGGMGVVWRAEDTILGRTVAIKVLPADISRDEERRRMFLEEARLASSLSEAHIVQVHEFRREGDLDFIVMEHVSGQPLDRRLDGRPLPPEQVAEWGSQVARALSRAHRKKLLHRDLKPGNVLITDEGDVKVVDFGLATLFAREADTATGSDLETRTSLLGSGGKVAGTLAYMSPEQVRGEKLGPQSDIFALGVMLYEMTTGRRPFRGPGAAEIAGQILKSRPTPVHELVPRVPLDLERIIDKALAPRPSDRYQTMEDLEVDLRRLGRELETGSSPAYEDLMSAVVRPPPARRPWVPLALAGAATALVLLAVWAVVGRGGGEGGAAAVEDRTVLVFPLEVRGQAQGADYVGRAFAEAMAVNLAQAKDLRVLPIPGDSEVDEFANRADMARAVGAGILLTGAITREPGNVHASVSMVDTVENRILWGAQRDVAAGDLAGLAASLAQEGIAELGLGSGKKYYDLATDLTGGPAMAASAELAETIGALRRSETEEAIAAAKRLTSAFPEETDAQILLAEALSRAYVNGFGEEDRLRLVRQAEVLQRLLPEAPYAALYGAWAGRAMGGGAKRVASFADAIETTTEILGRDDLTPAFRRELLRVRAWSQRNAGDPVTAVTDLEAALQLDPANAQILADLAYILREAGRAEEALGRARQAVALEPGVWFFHHATGHVLIGLGRYAEAARAYGRACEINRFQQPCAARAGALAQAGREAEAMAVAREAAAMEDTLAGVYNLACFHALAGRRDEAIRFLHRAFDLGWTSAWIAADPDLESLHGDPEFEEMISGIGTGTGEDR